MEEEILNDAKNGDSLLISKTMAEEEEKLLEARVKEDIERKEEMDEPPHLSNTQYSKLDELLTQTQLYSEFLLQKMDDITLVWFDTPFSYGYFRKDLIFATADYVKL